MSSSKAVIICSGRDDTNALILLTVRHLNAHCRVIVSAKEEENVKLFRQGGAQTVISPATFGGYLLADAVDQKYLADYVADFLTAGGQVNLVEQTVEDRDVGKTASDLLPDVLLRVYRQGTILSPWEFQGGQRLESGDVMLLFRPAQEDKSPLEDPEKKKWSPSSFFFSIPGSTLLLSGLLVIHVIGF